MKRNSTLRLKDKWQQRVKVGGKELQADVTHVTMLDGTMFGRLKSPDMHEIELIKRPGAGHWSPIFHKE